MKNRLASILAVLTVSATFSNIPSASANDLIDFLNAVHAISHAADHHAAPVRSVRRPSVSIQIGGSSGGIRVAERYPRSVLDVPRASHLHRSMSHYHVGDIVTGRVPLSPCVRIRNERCIAPDAIPVAMAVRDPHYCHAGDHEELVFVEVMLPQCELERVSISSNRTRVRLDYEHYSVTLQSFNDVVTITYGH